MRRIVDQTLLIIYCFVVLLLVSVNTAYVSAFLISVIFACANDYLLSQKWNGILTILYIVTSFFWPEFLFFTPVILYGVLRVSNYFLGIILMLLSMYTYFPGQIKILCVLGIGYGMAGILQEYAKRHEALEEKLKMTQDNSTELNILLKEKNQSLLKRQDYEIYTATLRERNRIAREIHDHVGHMLSRAILMVGAMKVISKEENMKEPLDHLEDTLNVAMTNVRESVHDLHDDAVNLKEVLDNLIKEYTFCSVQLTYDMGYYVPREVKYSFIAIVKEALNNVMKHSDATKVQILVREHPGLYQLIVEDNGTKCLKKEVVERSEIHRGIGLRNMEERTKALQGTMQISVKQGFRVYIIIPKKEETA